MDSALTGLLHSVFIELTYKPQLDSIFADGVNSVFKKVNILKQKYTKTKLSLYVISQKLMLNPSEMCQNKLFGSESNTSRSALYNRRAT
jgi:hypothetical protein